LLGLLLGDRALLTQPQVAVGVHEPRHDPTGGHGVGPRLRLEGDGAAHHVELDRLAVGKRRPGEPHRVHGWTLSKPAGVGGPAPRVAQSRSRSHAGPTARAPSPSTRALSIRSAVTTVTR